MEGQLETGRSLDRTGPPLTPELGDYLSVLKRRRWTVVQVVVVLVIALAITLWQIPVHESTVRLVLHPAANATEGQHVAQPVLDRREIETQIELIGSTPVAEIVRDELDLARSPDDLVEQVEAQVVGETNVVEITARDSAARRAAELAQGFAEGYLEFRRRQHEQVAAAAAASLEARMEELRASLQEVQTRKAGATEGDLAVVEREEDALLDQLGALSAQLAIHRSRQSLAGAGGEIIRPAEVPTTPASPDPVRNTILALVLGTVLGLGLAFLRDSLDDSLRADDDVIRATGEPVIGHIPRWKQKARKPPRLVTLSAPASPAAEAYATLRTNVRFLAVGGSFRSLLVTSAIQGEGKTTTASNLAVAFARAGSRILLVGADLRRPKLHRAFGRASAPGLSDVLAGDLDLDEAIIDVGVPNLGIVPCGNIPPNPAELLSSEAMAGLMGQLEQLADLVIYDGPPVLAAADALELSARVSAVLLVIDSAASPRRKPVRAAADRIHKVGGVLAGTVLAKVEPSDAYFAYGYLDQSAARGSKRARMG